MIKVLFLIHDLGAGGAENVLVNLVNNMDSSQFDISLHALFGGGVNRKRLASNVKYIESFPYAVPGNSKLMKLFSPKLLHRLLIKDQYDIEVSYLEGPSARIISGCKNGKTKRVTWIHSKLNKISAASSFYSFSEAEKCYESFDSIVCVSKGIENSFKELFPKTNSRILLNTIDSRKIKELSEKKTIEKKNNGVTELIAVGTLKKVKGFSRLINIVKRFSDENYNICLKICGDGPQKSELMNQIQRLNIEDKVKLLGFQSNPYQFMKNADLFVCSSYSEGYSTVTAEALILGLPVCTTKVPGMDELLGNNEFGMITENSEEDLYMGIKKLLDNPSLLDSYRKQAEFRGESLGINNTVDNVQNFLKELLSD